MTETLENLADIFKNAEHAARYAEGPRRFVPGFDGLHRIMLQVLRERMPKDGKVLVLGAGGGLEILTMAQAEHEWTFCGVDPSAEMLAAARLTLGDAASRVDWIEGLIFDAPRTLFDGGTCMLTLHFVPDDGAKLDTLKAMRARLKPGAPFVIAHMAIDKNATDADLQFERYARYSEDSGTDPEMVARARTHVKAMLHSVGPGRDEALLKEAGFTGVELVFAGLVWRGWVGYA
jgi:tRNA (cmo5U34)-methyltransferase